MEKGRKKTQTRKVSQEILEFFSLSLSFIFSPFLSICFLQNQIKSYNSLRLFCFIFSKDASNNFSVKVNQFKLAPQNFPQRIFRRKTNETDLGKQSSWELNNLVDLGEEKTSNKTFSLLVVDVVKQIAKFHSFLITILLNLSSKTEIKFNIREDTYTDKQAFLFTLACL